MTKLEIFKLAAGYLGQATVNNVDEQTVLAAACREYFDVSKHEVLTQFDWQFAKKRVALTDEIAVDPTLTSGYAWSYELPTDFINIVSIDAEVWQQPNSNMYQVESSLLTVELGKFMVYIADVSEELFSKNAANLLAMCLAVNVCVRVTNNPALLNALSARYEKLKGEVATVAAADTGGVRNTYHQRLVTKRNPIRNRYF